VASTFSAIEILHAKKYKEYINLSMQEIIDCSHENEHCKGGQPSSVADYILQYGISTEENYPYLARKSSRCRAKYYYNKKRKKAKKKRVLEELLSPPPPESATSEERILQRVRDRPKFVAKYDEEQKKFYYEVTYLDGSVRYKDITRNPFIPSHMKSNNSAYYAVGSNQICFRKLTFKQEIKEIKEKNQKNKKK
jgi:hypothetical protein